MESWLKIALLIVWLPRALRQSLLWLHWIQVKEYRPDRFGELLSTAEGRARVELPLIALKTAAVLLWVFGEVAMDNVLTTGLMYAALLIYADGRLTYEIWRRKLRRPVFTLRANEILITQGLGILLIVALLLGSIVVSPILLLGELVLLIAPFIGVAWTTPLVQRTKRRDVAQAQAHLTQVNPTVVGITGSYGKSTTKEFTAHLLSQAYRTAKTPTSINTDFGVARHAKTLPDHTQYYVVEAGAYRIGEVKSIIDFVQPHVGMVTGLEPQHLTLFGSFENIITAKSEMPLGVRQNGIVVFNFSNAEVRKMAQTVRGKRPDLTVKGYALQSSSQSALEADCVSRVISADTRSVTFETTYNGETWALRAPVNGVHFVENLTGAILIARLFNVSWEQIAEGCRTVQTPKQTMQVYELDNGVMVIDDSYNATPTGFESALRYLRLFPSDQRVVITSGVIELGSKTDEVHQGLGGQMRENVSQILLTEKGFAASLGKGLGDQLARLKIVRGEDDALPVLDALPAGSVLLLEGRMPIYVTKWVQAHKRSEVANG